MNSANTDAATIDRLSRERKDSSPRVRLVVTLLLLAGVLVASGIEFRRGDPIGGVLLLALALVFALPFHRLRGTRLGLVLLCTGTAISGALLFRALARENYLGSGLAVLGLQGMRLPAELARSAFLDRLWRRGSA